MKADVIINYKISTDTLLFMDFIHQVPSQTCQTMLGFKPRQNDETDTEYLQIKLNLIVSVKIIIIIGTSFARDAGSAQAVLVNQSFPPPELKI